jgi:hypothetical protein
MITVLQAEGSNRNLLEGNEETPVVISQIRGETNPDILTGQAR